MELAWLESFLALCEHQSFTRAAASQHISQPAFSRRIRSLERWVGTELFDRSTYPVALTEAGIRLRSEAAFITQALTGIRDQIGGVAYPVDRTVRIATSHTLAAHYFPQWWRRVSEGLGETHCQLLPMDTFDAYDALVNGGCDLLLAHVDPLQPPPTDQGRLESVTVATDTLRPYTQLVNGRPRYQLPTRVGASVPFVSHGAAVFLGRITDRLLGEDRRRYTTVVQTDLTSAVAHLVAAGAGVSWLPTTVATDLTAAGRIAPLADSGLTATLDVRVHRRPEARVNAFLQTLWLAISSDSNPVESNSER